mmetsp:Transcript_138479/g.244614  ORF Transcript_138479/g.244614 Transcript_138479/m.244614 type:complete len:123 (+) Transcript_138479:138-506(+)
MAARSDWVSNVDRLLAKLEQQHPKISIISSPYMICKEQCEEVVAECAKQGYWCFNPDAHFSLIGVTPDLGGACWVQGWHGVLKIVIRQGGKAYFLWSETPGREGLLGGQQGGEYSLCFDAEG